MDDMRDYEIDCLKRQLAGLPPRPEITLSADASMTADGMIKQASKLWQEVCKKHGVSE